MSGYSQYLSAPVTQQAVVSVNAGLDRIFCNFRKSLPKEKIVDGTVSTDDHVYTIQQRELVFTLSPKLDAIISRPSSNGINDIALKVFSSANNFIRAANIPDTLVQRSYTDRLRVRESLRFVGVAVTPIDYTKTNQKDNCAVQVAGSITIYNTGSHIIRPGDKVLWDFPDTEPKAGSVGMKRTRITGEPLSKVLFATVPMHAFLKEGVSTTKVYSFVDYILAAHPHGPATGQRATPEAKILDDLWKTAQADVKGMKEYLKAMLFLYQEVESRIIGTALSGANPGEQFDIMLSSGH